MNRTEALRHYPNLRFANLRDADLYAADLRDASLRDADLRGADLTGVRIEGAALPMSLRIRQAWAGGPRHRTATVWSWDGGAVEVGQGCVRATEPSREVWDRLLRANVGPGWRDGDIVHAVDAVFDAIGRLSRR
jgi:hypothetical protein